MADIFVLQGIGNCGKTTTLKMVFDELKARKPSPVVHNLNTRLRTEIKVVMKPCKGHIVGIASIGDYPEALLESFRDFKKAGCDIIFCAVRTSGATVPAVQSQQGNNNVQWIQQTVTATNQATANNNMALHLIKIAGL
ncbi:hypothetical protein FACS189485_14990 [Spirochaetia bacterium]|nr:hypothetical protein FACS189485_14990 [Spirochaetia bacterium]